MARDRERRDRAELRPGRRSLPRHHLRRVLRRRLRRAARRRLPHSCADRAGGGTVLRTTIGATTMMQSTLINHPRLRVERHTGSEGPRHDPYAYEEWRVRMPGHTIVLHSGLGTWLRADGVDVKNVAHLPHDQFE